MMPHNARCLFPHWKHALLAAVFLLVGSPGCQLPPQPNRVDAAEYHRPPDSRVTQASAVMPAPDAHTTILPPAGPELDQGEQEDSGFQLEDLAPSNLYKGFKNAVGLGPNEQIARTAYQEGEELYDQKKYGDAAEKFATAASRWPDSVLEEDALFMQGESYFFADQYSKASDTFQKLLKKHPFSRHLDKAVARLFDIGRYWEQMHAAEPHWPVTPNFTDGTRPLFDTWGHALKAYEQIRLNDPNGPLADDSVIASANAYFLTGRYEDAAYHYDLLRKEYPKSEHQVAAHVLGVKSKLNIYQGSLYDGEPLEDASEIAQQALTQFPGQLGAEKELMIRAKNGIVEQQAERDWAIAQYYDKKKFYGAARLYYEAILKDYPQTSVAEAARTRLEEIRGFPAEPPNRFKFLTDMFSSKQELIPEGPAQTLDIQP